MKKLVLFTILVALTYSSVDAAIFYSRKMRGCGPGGMCGGIDNIDNFLFHVIRCQGPGSTQCPLILPSMNDEEMNGLILLANKSLDSDYLETGENKGVINSPNYNLRFVKFKDGYNMVVHDKNLENIDEVLKELYSE